LLEQLSGTEEKSGSPTIWMGVELACSPAIFTSAVSTGPQVSPLTNSKHSTTGFPELVCLGNVNPEGSADDKIRSPVDPVSINIPPMVAHVEVPGLQIVTLVTGMLERPAGLLLTVMDATLFVPDVGGVTGLPPALDSVEPPQPENPIKHDKSRRNGTPVGRRHFLLDCIGGHPLWDHLRNEGAANE
jgi:hypothetical protein